MSTLEEEIERIHRSGTKLARRLAYASAVVFILLCSLTGWALYTRFEQAKSARHDSKVLWHAVLCQVEIATLREPSIPQAKKEEALRFYDGLLVNIVHTAPCGLQGGSK